MTTGIKTKSGSLTPSCVEPSQVHCGIAHKPGMYEQTMGVHRGREHGGERERGERPRGEREREQGEREGDRKREREETRRERESEREREREREGERERESEARERICNISCLFLFILEVV